MMTGYMIALIAVSTLGWFLASTLGTMAYFANEQR
jgi:hypothetical protein